MLGTRTELVQTSCIVPVCNVVGLIGMLLLDVGLLGGGLDLVSGTTVLLVLLQVAHVLVHPLDGDWASSGVLFSQSSLQ